MMLSHRHAVHDRGPLENWIWSAVPVAYLTCHMCGWCALLEVDRFVLVLLAARSRSLGAQTIVAGLPSSATRTIVPVNYQVDTVPSMLRDVCRLTPDWSIILTHVDALSSWKYRNTYRYQVTLKSLAGLSPFSLRRSVRDTFDLSADVRAWDYCTIAAAVCIPLMHPAPLLHYRGSVARALPYMCKRVVLQPTLRKDSLGVWTLLGTCEYDAGLCTNATT